MCKKHAKLPRGMTQEDVREAIRERKRKAQFIGKLKHGEDGEYVRMTHDGSDFTIRHRSNGDFWVTYD